MKALLIALFAALCFSLTSCPEPPPPQLESNIQVVFDNETTSMLPFYEITINDSFLVKNVVSVSYDSVVYENFDGDTSMYLPMGTKTTIYFRLKSYEDKE